MHETNGGLRKYTLAAVVVAASAAALGSFTFGICPQCTDQRLIQQEIEVPKEPEKGPEPKQETSRRWTTTDS